MKIAKLEELVALGEAKASYDAATRTLEVSGERGTLRRLLYHPAVRITVENERIRFVAEQATLREKKRLNAFAAHARNMVRGVTEGFIYRLKICSGHFPMSVAVKGREFEVKNFIGEKVPRRLALKEGVEVAVEGDQVVVTGADKELVGQTAADIEQLTRRPGFDTRVFQDGIFITEKDGKQV